MSVGKFFLDTNIFVYTFDSAAPGKQEISRQLVSNAINSRHGVISYQVVQEFYNVVFTRFPGTMSHAEGYLYFGNVFRPLFSVSFSPALLFQAIRIRELYGLSWHDSLIVSAALEVDCEILYSEDFQHGQKFGELTVRNPF